MIQRKCEFGVRHSGCTTCRTPKYKQGNPWIGSWKLSWCIRRCKGSLMLTPAFYSPALCDARSELPRSYEIFLVFIYLSPISTLLSPQSLRTDQQSKAPHVESLWNSLRAVKYLAPPFPSRLSAEFLTPVQTLTRIHSVIQALTQQELWTFRWSRHSRQWLSR